MGAGLVGQQQRSRRAQVEISGLQVTLIEWSKIIDQRQALLGQFQLEHGIAEVRIAVENAIRGHNVNVAAV